MCGALVLQQVAYWASFNLHVRPDGNSWVYKTYEGLADDTGIYSASSVKRALPVLKRLGVLVVGKGMNKMGYDKTNWYRVDKIALGELLKTDCPSGSKRPVPSGQNDPFHKVNMTLPIPETNHRDYPETPNTNTGGDKSPVKHMKAEDVLKGMGKTGIPKTGEPTLPSPPIGIQGETPLPPLPKISAVKSGQPLHIRWKAHQSSATGGFVPDLKAKDKGQLGHITKAIGPVMAAQVIDYVWTYWLRFTEKARADKDLKSAPATPQIGFTLMHYDIALQLIALKETQDLAKAAQESSYAAFMAKPTLPQQEVAQTPPKPDNSTVQSIAKVEGMTPDEIQEELEFFANLTAQKLTKQKGGGI